jgi:hypothetical protein
MRIRGMAVVVFMLAAAACSMSTDYRKSIEGNNTGGLIPHPMAKGGDPQRLASAHCAKYNSSARITYDGLNSGGDVVFVCETAAGSGAFATPGALAAPAAQGTAQAPAVKQAPVTR